MKASIASMLSADWFGAYVLPPIIAEYAKAFPRVQVEVLTGTRLFNLAQREADIAFRIVPFDAPDIIQRRLVDMRYGVYVAAGSADPVKGNGADHRLITMDTSTGDFPDITWLNTRLPNAGVALRSNNRNVQAQMCSRGIGVAVLPRPVGDQIPNLRRLDLGEEPPRREIWMGYHRDLRRLHRLRAFVDLASKNLSD